MRVESRGVVCGGRALSVAFPDRGALVRLVGAVLAEQHDEWIEGRRHLGLDVLARSRMTLIETPDTTNDNQAMTPAELTA